MAAQRANAPKCLRGNTFTLLLRTRRNLQIGAVVVAPERADIMIVHVKFAGGLHSFTVDGSAKLPELAQLMKTVDAQLDADSVKFVGAKLSKSAVYPSRMPGTSLIDAGASRRQRCIPLQH